MKAKKLLLAILLALLTDGGATTMGQETQADARDRIRRGNELYARAEYEAAIEEYRRVPQRGAGDAYAQSLYNIGVCYYELGRIEEAIVMYRNATSAARAGRYPKAFYALGVALEDLGQLPEAEAAYQRAIDESGGAHAPAHFKLGLLVVARTGDYEAAATLFRKAIARSGENFPNSHNNLGVMLARMGRLAEAAREFEIALRQTDGASDEATHNLKLCRLLLAGKAGTQLAAMKIVEAPVALNK